MSPDLLNTCFVPHADREWRALRLQERADDREIERKTRIIPIFIMDMKKHRTNRRRQRAFGATFCDGKSKK